MENMRYFSYVCILLILKSQFIVGNTKDCDCKGTKKMVNRVRKILLKDMFDMKLQNDVLSSKIDKLERMFQEQFPVSVSSATQDTKQNVGVDSKGLEVDTDTEEANKTPEMDSRMKRLIIAFQSEKKQRLQMESVVRHELRTLNDSFNTFTNHMEAAFTKSVKSMTEKIQNFEWNVTDSLSDVERKYKSSIDDVQKLLSGVIETNLTDLQYELDSISQNVSRLDMEVSSVIDNAILNKTDSCERNCSNGGVCFKDNTCRCKRFTEGTRCEKFFCDESCTENGGECIGPGSCNCPDHRDGVNCELVIKCELIKPSSGVSISYFGNLKPETVASFTCNDDEYELFPSNLKSSECTRDFKWNPEPPACLKPCTDFEFQCESDGSCIGFARCNGAKDCSDGSDEMNCHCQQDELRCLTGQCVKVTSVCDGIDDCVDGLDEINCGDCDQNEIPCPSGRCISKAWICDGDNDCVDGFDESSCGCQRDEFMCLTGQYVNFTSFCDGIDDCVDGFDEINCGLM